MTLSPAARWTLGATATMAVAMGISRFAYTPLLPPMRDAFDWTVTQTGDLASLNYLGYLVGALLAPRALERIALLPLLATALIGCVLTSALGTYASSFLAWGALRVVAGIASALCLVAVTTRLGALLAAEPGTRLGHLHFSGVGLGIILSVLLVRDAGIGTATAVADSWAKLAGISAALLLPSWALFRSVPEPAVSTPARAIATGPATQPASTALQGRLRRITAGYGLFGFGYIITATFIVAIAESSATSPQAAQDVWLSAGLAAMPSVPLWHALSQRYGLARTLAAAYLVEALSVLLAAVADSTALVHLAAALLGGTFAGITALGLALGSSLAGPAAARVIGTMTAIFAIGQLIGPGIAGRLTTLTGSFVVPSVIAALALALAAALLWQPSADPQNDRTALTG